jgi:hypothetical protein
LGVNKISWQQAGHVTQPGRYMFRFGWLTVSPEDISVWEKFPNAVFALVRTAAAKTTPAEAGEEYHLGVFEFQTGPLADEK